MNIVVDLKVISFTVAKTLKELTKNKKNKCFKSGFDCYTPDKIWVKRVMVIVFNYPLQVQNELFKYLN